MAWWTRRRARPWPTGKKCGSTAPQPLAVQVAQLLALTDRTLDRVPVEMVPRFRAALATLLEGRGAALATRLAAGADLDGTARADLGLLAAEAARIACLSDEPRQA
nr:hypothetical protein [Azospirillum brasilense]